MYALMYPILYIASIHCYIPLSTATSMSVCSVCIVLWHDHVNGEIKALKRKHSPAFPRFCRCNGCHGSDYSTCLQKSADMNALRNRKSKCFFTKRIHYCNSFDIIIWHDAYLFRMKQFLTTGRTEKNNVESGKPLARFLDFVTMTTFQMVCWKKVQLSQMPQGNFRLFIGQHRKWITIDSSTVQYAACKSSHFHPYHIALYAHQTICSMVALHTQGSG